MSVLPDPWPRHRTASDPTEAVFAYHEQTKHRLEKYAAGPETLDWDMQPNPFREFEGAPRTLLPLGADKLTTPFADIDQPGAVPPRAMTLQSISHLLELSMGLSAWKELGPDRWALRCNPSSGNLHPTEAYVLARGIPGLRNGLHHYLSRDHVLELRCEEPVDTDSGSRLWIGLSSIHWREAWKYGERAFRYCQLDLGHAIGALRYAAGTLGWRVDIVPGLPSAQIAPLLGVDRKQDFDPAEPEEADVLLSVHLPDTTVSTSETFALRGNHWTGTANALDPQQMYQWPIIDDVAASSRLDDSAQTTMAQPAPDYPALEAVAKSQASSIILNRRSAQRFDNKYLMSAGLFYHMLDALLPRTIAPWDVWAFPARIHPILFVHRVDGIESGAYILPRSQAAEPELRQKLDQTFAWKKPSTTPDHLPLYCLTLGDNRNFIRTVSCHQFIASDSCFAVSMLAEFEAPVRDNAWHYRQLHWEAGLLGQVLYLESEAAGLRGTGIGCFFDDSLHQALGLEGRQFQVLYNFTVGRPLLDLRITSLPAYPGRHISNPEELLP